MQKITEDEFNRDLGHWQQEALEEPVVIMKDGVPVLYLLSAPVFDSLRVGSRRAVAVSDLDERGKKALREAQVAPEHDHLNALLEEDE